MACAVRKFREPPPPLPGGAGGGRRPGRAPGARPRTTVGTVTGRTRRFLRSGRGAVALESALALVVLVSAFAGLMHIVGDTYAEDRAGRAARAVAFALALDPGADPWAALRREGSLELGATCPEWTGTEAAADCGGWTLTVHLGVSPATLAKVLDGMSAAKGEMVLVRLVKTPPQGTRSAGTPPVQDGATRVAGIGLARRELGS